jgi:hypothetical protein
VLAAFLFWGCQKELYEPTTPIIPPGNQTVSVVKKASDTFFVRAFYGHQGITPPAVGTVIFPQYAYEVPPVNKMAFMSAYTGLNGYGDSANTIKKNAINMYNGEFYNNDVKAQGNAWITITPTSQPLSDWSVVSTGGDFAYDKFFSQSKKLLISIKLVNGAFQHSDTAANGNIINYRMDKLNLVAMESVETGLATKESIQKLKNGQSETYLTFVNRQGIIMMPLKNAAGSKMVAWRPFLFP